MFGCLWIKSYSGQTFTVAHNGQEDLYTCFDISYYDDDRYAIEDMVDELEAAITQILSQVSGVTTFEYALQKHDALCELVTYDETKPLPHVHDIYGALVNHVAVCDGYSSAFAYLMGRLGYDVELVRSQDHAWDVVEDVYSDERFVDVTWDDLDASDIYGKSYISHDYLFLTADEMALVGDHTLVEPLEYQSEGAYGNHYNYHRICNAFLERSDPNSITSIFKQQLDDGQNYITFRFVNWDAYQRTFRFFLDASEERDELLEYVGYEGSYIIRYNDNTMTIGIELNTQGN